MTPELTDERMKNLNADLQIYEGGGYDKVPVDPKDLRDLLGEVERLRGVVSKLPVTADGAPVVPGMEVFERLHRGGVQRLIVNMAACGASENDDSPVDCCYSTRELAEAARAARGGQS